MDINKYTNFKVVSGISKKEHKEYYAIVLKVGEVEKVIAFLTKDQYLLITSLAK